MFKFENIGWIFFLIMNFKLKLMQILEMSKNNLKCDVHITIKNQMQNFCVCDHNLWGA